MSFTTWSALEAQMLNDLVAGNTTHGSYNISGNEINFKSHLDWLRLYTMVQQKAQSETGAAVGRTYAKNGRTG